MPAFQQAWKDGALVEDLFGPSPFTLHGSVGRSGADNFRPDVAKVETFLGDAGYYKPLTNDGPSGWHNGNLDEAIRTFQKDKGLEVDGFLKPGGPTIGKIGSLLGGGEPQAQGQDKSGVQVQGVWGGPNNDWPGVPLPGEDPQSPSHPDGRDPWPLDPPTTFPEPKPRPPLGGPDLSGGALTPQQQLEALIRIMTGGKTPQPRPPIIEERPQSTPPRRPPVGNDLPEDGGYTGRLPRPKNEDWFKGHTINQDGIDANQAYAEMLVRDTDPSQTARMLKRAIDDYGDQGRGDVADLLARFQKIDGAKAEDLRRELHKTTGEMLPYRLAPLGEGFREPTEEEKIAAAPQTPFGSAQGADRWAAGNMAAALLGRGDYADAITHFRGEIGRNRAETMPYLAAVHEIMGDKNPGLAARFATQMHKAGLTQTTSDGAQPKSAVRIVITRPGEPEGAPVEATGPNSEGAGKRTPSDPKYGDETTPPEWKKATLHSQGSAWKDFNTSVGNLSGVSDNERFVYGQVFAAEGGKAVDPNSGASSGITKQTLEDARNAGAVPGLDKVKSPGDLTMDQRAGIMRWYFDKTMEKAGGSAALDKISDKLAAGALADSIYRHGSNAGTKLIQTAINKVSGQESLKVDGGMGGATLDAYAKLVSNPETRDKLLNTLADLRDTATQGREKDRMDHYRPKK